MKPDDLGCGSPARCDADLPDSPQCAPNYHFGMLLGVADFRAEQGFHLGQHRRHQRSLHGVGVVAGYGVSFKSAEMEVRVAPGQAVDRLGRDVVLDRAQCVSLPLWWQTHRHDEAFADIPDPNDATFDLDVQLCWCACLGSPVPAIADPCAGDSADIAYSRVCETARLALVRATAKGPPSDPRFHLLRMWLQQVGPRLDGDGHPLPADQWLIDRYQALIALPQADQAAERARIGAEVLARAVAELPLELPDTNDTCLTLARLEGVHLKQDASGWHASINSIEIGGRPSLLPTSLLQSLLLADPDAGPPAAGPVVAHNGLGLTGQTLSVTFTQPLAASSVTSSVLLVNEFIAGTGWRSMAVQPSYAGGTSLSVTLDREPTGQRLRLTVVGSGPTPLLGATLIPAGALSPEGDGRTLSTTLSL
jgi:hypothetical protein